MKDYLTFSLAVAVVICATVLFAMSKLDQTAWQWSVTTAIGCYTARSIAAKAFAKNGG